MKKLSPEQRLEAAEKTVAVLKEKVKSLYSGDSPSIIQKQLLIAKNKSETIRVEQNKAMQEILDHVVFGFLTIDRNHEVLKGCSRSVYELFDREQVVGRTIGENLGLDEATADYLMLCVDEVFEDLLPESVTLAQIPNKFKLNDKVLKLEGRTIRSSKGFLEKILFTITDISELEETQKIAQQNDMLVTILRTKDAFLEFLFETKKAFSETLRLDLKSEQAATRRLIHTIKGNYASFGMRELVELAHEVEGASVIELEHLEQLQNSLVNFLKDHWSILEISYDDISCNHLAISNEQLFSLKDIIKDLPENKRREIEAWTSAIALKPANTLLGPMDEFSTKLAHRLGKDVELTIEGKQCLVNSGLLRPVFQNLTHLVRNAIDHGIEEFHERKAREKPRLGRVSITIESWAEHYYITVADDGRGIDPEVLKKKAVSQQIVDQQKVSGLNDSQAMELIFVDGFSTSDLNNEVSGRGIGMAAIKAVIESVGGTLKVESELHKGTSFKIEVKKNSVFTKLPAEKAAS